MAWLTFAIIVPAPCVGLIALVTCHQFDDGSGGRPKPPEWIFLDVESLGAWDSSCPVLRTGSNNKIARLDGQGSDEGESAFWEKISGNMDIARGRMMRRGICKSILVRSSSLRSSRPR